MLRSTPLTCFPRSSSILYLDVGSLGSALVERSSTTTTTTTSSYCCYSLHGSDIFNEEGAEVVM